MPEFSGGRGFDLLMGEVGNDILIGGFDQWSKDGELDSIVGGTGMDTSCGRQKKAIIGVENTNK